MIFQLHQLPNYLSWRSGQISDEWKLGHIVPISKSPYINLPNDYWRESFLSNISNVLECDIRYTTIRNLCINSPLTLLLSMEIYERSIHCYYITVYNWWIVKNRDEVCAVFFDFKKDFHSVPCHAPLLSIICMIHWVKIMTLLIGLPTTSETEDSLL